MMPRRAHRCVYFVLAFGKEMAAMEHSDWSLILPTGKKHQSLYISLVLSGISVHSAAQTGLLWQFNEGNI